MQMKPPKYPVYDPAKDGNKFDWILKAAQKLREQERPKPPAVDWMTGKPDETAP